MQVEWRGEGGEGVYTFWRCVGSLVGSGQVMHCTGAFETQEARCTGHGTEPES